MRQTILLDMLDDTLRSSYKAWVLHKPDDDHALNEW